MNAVLYHYMPARARTFKAGATDPDRTFELTPRGHSVATTPRARSIILPAAHRTVLPYPRSHFVVLRSVE